MDPSPAFDEQIAREVLHAVGPSEPVDATAIFSTITATRSPKWRFQPMVGAIKFVVAGAIVALFGGFLLLTEPPADDRTPAVGVSASASPSLVDDRSALDRYLELRSRLSTEEVGPGVQRVLSDGAGHELADLGPTEEYSASISIARDGSVWLLTPERLVQLGEPGSNPGAGDRWPKLNHDLTIATDGTPWALRGGVSPDRDEVLRLQDSEWIAIPHGERQGRALEILPDGSLWTRDADTLARLDEDAWTTFEFRDAAISLPDEDEHVFPVDLASTPDGSLWVAFSVWEQYSPMRGGLARFDGSSWELVEPLGEDYISVPVSLAASEDGVLWVALTGCQGVGCEGDAARRQPFLARLDGDGWTVLGEEDGAEPVGRPGWWVGQMAVAPGGRLLATVDRRGADTTPGWTSGFAIFDRDGLMATLPDAWPGDGVASMAGAPDGTFWVVDGGDVYIIDPETVAAAEPSKVEPTPSDVLPDASESGLLPGVDLVAEEVEPGVLRVLDDGAGHDLATMHLGGVWAGKDGSIWALEEPFAGAGYGNRLLRLGRAGDTPIDIGQSYWFDMAVDADGTVWAKTLADYGIGVLATNDGTTVPWRTRSAPESFSGSEDGAAVRAVEAGPDGSIWVTRAVQDGAGPRVARHDDSGWTVLPTPDDSEMQGDYQGEGPYVDVGPDGAVWIANGSHQDTPGPGPHGVLRFDGVAWVPESPVSEPTDLHAGPLAVGPDGTAWVYLYSRQEDLPDGLRHILARWSDGEWTSYGFSEGVMSLAGYGSVARLAVDQAGTLWIAFSPGGGPYMSFAQRAAGLENPTPEEGPCPGLLSFDGTSWRQYLRGRCVNNVAVAPDSSIWASAATHPDSTDLDIDAIDGLYVIVPEVAAARE